MVSTPDPATHEPFAESVRLAMKASSRVHLSSTKIVVAFTNEQLINSAVIQVILYKLNVDNIHGGGLNVVLILILVDDHY